MTVSRGRAHQKTPGKRSMRKERVTYCAHCSLVDQRLLNSLSLWEKECGVSVKPEEVAAAAPALAAGQVCLPSTAVEGVMGEKADTFSSPRRVKGVCTVSSGEMCPAAGTVVSSVSLGRDSTSVDVVWELPSP